jgi:hypothetical protein
MEQNNPIGPSKYSDIMYDVENMSKHQLEVLQDIIRFELKFRRSGE